ncbi:hypothetical protein MC25239_00515 [Moraxella catarrhalis]|nr:hypothetical protein DR90_1408 [Moraxella catarrhalis]AIT42949.1 hypothetical protein MC25239_00515 [Moraxella catarrhalis]SQH69535.1 Uncharacterised protein [Moraxella catarrhalis]STY81380.1 Uncharacterised protein [Moraxella catarrhalis]
MTESIDYKNTLNLADTAFFGLNIEKNILKTMV